MNKFNIFMPIMNWLLHLFIVIHAQEKGMKILLWVILIIFLIGLLVVTGVFKMIF
ncbi:hypothetical protein [Enterobacter mori]